MVYFDETLAFVRNECIMVRNISTVAMMAALFSAAFAQGDAEAGQLFHYSNAPYEGPVYSFQSGDDGIGPYSNLITDGSGAFYGTTYKGGPIGGGPFDGKGTVYKLIPRRNGFDEIVLYSFRGKPDGWEPHGALFEDRSGALYGTTYYGGSADLGTVFKLTPGPRGYVESILHSFLGGVDGDYPDSSLIADASGAVYGTTQGGGGGMYGNGTVFKLTPANGTAYSESIVYAFKGGTDGANPSGSLIADMSGAFYGTTSNGGGGTYGNGTVFKLTPHQSGYRESVLYRFQGGLDGANPFGALLADGSGAFYGTTTAGGAANAGTVFKLSSNASGYSESVLYGFDGIVEYCPQSSLVADSAGALYGTTSGTGIGGTKSLGTVFKLTPGTNGYTEHIIHRFAGGSEGSNPFDSLILTTAGTLFGTTNGHYTNDGSVFALSPHGGQYTLQLLHSFHREDDGAHPFGGVTPGALGVLYGTTMGGGTIDQGTVFEAVPSANGFREQVLYRFQGGENGLTPFTAPIADSAGALYGTTGGTVYKLTPNGSKYKETILHDFRRADGFDPSSLIVDGRGALYGANQYGGPHQSGAVFKLTPTHGGYAYNIIHAFKHAGDGDFPAAPLIGDGTGALYGTTSQGGSGSAGTVFKLTPIGGRYSETILHNFDNNIDGAYPTTNLILDGSGAVYGTTSLGPGNGGCGAVFKLTPSHGMYVETFLHVFTANPDGCQPSGSLIRESNGVIYGTTEFGGDSGQGCIFQVSAEGGSDTESVLYSFTNDILEGGHPTGSIFADARGAIYGTTYDGGRLGQGTIYLLVP
jgi:uncharacterized repeat protein (TIGR03803 family)